MTLDHGDILTLFTDGVTEQENEAGDDFPSTVWKKLLKQRNNTASALVTQISEAVSTFAGKSTGG